MTLITTFNKKVYKHFSIINNVTQYKSIIVLHKYLVLLVKKMGKGWFYYNCTFLEHAPRELLCRYLVGKSQFKLFLYSGHNKTIMIMFHHCKAYNSYLSQLSVDIKIKKYKIKASLFSPEGLKVFILRFLF